MAKRTCLDCGGDIPGAKPATKRCPDCYADFMRAAGVEPLEPYPGPGVPWKCQCMTCDAVISPRYNDVQQGQGACRECGIAARVDARRIPEVQVMALARAVGLEPLEPYRSNHTRWLCRCLACGRTTSPMLTSLKRGSEGCGWCSRHYIHPDEAFAIMRAAGLEPLTPYSGSNDPWPSQCLNCGFVGKPTCYNVSAGHGCRGCSLGGFQASEPAIVYLVAHAGYGATKIGIANEGSGRLEKHRRQGWQVVITAGAAGAVAQDVEADILRWWRNDLRLPIHLGPEEMPYGGWTETVASCEVDLAATISRIRRST